MKRVIVIGCPGAGKSTFARKLRDRTGLPLHYLDRLWHKADKTHIPREEFDGRLADILTEDRWIVDGNYGRTLEMRLRYCDTVFLLDIEPEVCLAGVRSRIGCEREDMPWIETELDPEFQQQIEAFPSHELPGIYALLDRYRPGREVVIFRSREETEDYLSGTRFSP